MLTQQIRRQFLSYFQDKGHSIISSAPVLPHDDPTLLFNNAGMNQFKDIFLGKSVRDYSRATTSQKCIRAGGKHNDLDNVGHTSRHLTFFEMLGNFSFGDYFKKDAIRFSWEVSTEVFGFNPENIWPSVYKDDDEAFELWTQYVPVERIARFGKSENFWAMGDTGPCGPCSELYYDRGDAYGDAKHLQDDPDGDRYIEFWNLVFMQYNMLEDGQMAPLPKPSIDTGSGLERVVALKMGVDSLFETDILIRIIAEVEKISGQKYDFHQEKVAPAFRVIADHLRCLAFAIADGVQPSNVDRGYVLRKILRRAVRYGRMLGLVRPFLADALPALCETMGEDYPEIVKAEGRIGEILTIEEESFIRTLQRGGNILQQIMDHAKKHGRQITGDEAFKLKDTYGFPIEEILLLAKDENLTVDVDRFEDLELEAKERSRTAHKVTKQVAEESLFSDFVKNKGVSEFLGYTDHAVESVVKGIVIEGTFVDALPEGEEGIVILDRTPFYGEKGGQVGDTGTLIGEGAHFQVTDCQEPFNGVVAHIGKVTKGNLCVGTAVEAAIDGPRRLKIANNHTATHLLHWALHQVLGEHVKQAGSVVDDKRLRFDFSHHKALTQKEIRAIEDLVNSKIRENFSVNSYEIPYEEAQKSDEIKQFFGEKYGTSVRVIDIDFSKELCGGTHTTATGNIGYFRIAKEGSIAAGIRRIEAVSGGIAEGIARQSEDKMTTLAEMLKIQPQKVLDRISRIIEENKQLSQHLKDAKEGKIATLVNDLVDQMETVNDIPFISAELTLSPKELRVLADQVMNKLPSVVVVLAARSEDKCQLMTCVSDDLIEKGIRAQEIIKEIAPIVGGGGGGKANTAQAGGKVPEKIPDALAKARELLKA